MEGVYVSAEEFTCET